MAATATAEKSSTSTATLRMELVGGKQVWTMPKRERTQIENVLGKVKALESLPDFQDGAAEAREGLTKILAKLSSDE